MTILKVTEVKETLIIGKFYLVPCVTMPVDIEGFKAGKPIPVIGELHADPSLGVSQLHYHYDHRFIKPEIYVAFIVSVRVSETPGNSSSSRGVLEKTEMLSQQYLLSRAFLPHSWTRICSMSFNQRDMSSQELSSDWTRTRLWEQCNLSWTWA